MTTDEFDAVLKRDILYELFIYSEWVQEPELVTKFGYGGLDNSQGSGLMSWLLPTPSISAPVLWHRTSYPPWQLSLSPDNRLVAVLKDNCAEIRSTKDDFATVIATCPIASDPLPQFRCLSWSSDTTMLAISSSTGRVVLFDLAGEILYTIDEDPLAKLEGGGFALVNMLWTDERTKKTRWCYEMITITFNGQVRGYLVNSDTFSLSFQMDLPIVQGSIGAAVYHPRYSLILIGSDSFRLMENADASDPSLVSSQVGISAWKLVAEEPYIQKIETIHQDTASFFSFLTSLFRSQAEDAVCSLSISPSGNQLLCLHSSGVASLWSLPGLILMKMWKSCELPNFKATNPHLLESEKLIQEKTKGFHNSIHVDWWSEDKMIIVRRCGSISVVSVESGRNLLGENPEWFGVAPRLASMPNMGFLTIECEWQMGLSKTRTNSPFIGSELTTSFHSDDTRNEGEESQFSWLGRLISMAPVRKVIEYVTDINLHEVKQRRVVKIYRLLGLKSTTPQELFAVKINNGEYMEALDLANRYDLDSDPVYQHQWRKTEPNKTNIDSLLHKVKNKSWVLQECLQKLTNDPVATRELLLYGLRVTNIFAITKTPSNQVPEDVTEEELFQKKLIQSIHVDQLSLEQKWMVDCRRKFLRYLDALQIYESFTDTFDPAEMVWFRQQSPLEAAVHFARRGRAETVIALLTFHTQELSKHWLPILNQFPETCSPALYAKLLPYTISKPPHNIRHWHAVHIRTEVDWAEKLMKTCIFAEEWNAAEKEFYERNPDCKQWRSDTPLEADFVAKWYLSRIRAIEASTFLMENALDLVRLAYQKLRPQGDFASQLMRLQHNLLTLEMVTFDCCVENVTLTVIEQKTVTEQLKMIMQNATELNYLSCVRRWLLPFIEHCERSSPGAKFNLLKIYFSELAEDHLGRVVQVWEFLKEEPNRDIITDDLGNQIELCITCCERSRRASQLQQAHLLLNLLPAKPATVTPRVDALFKELESLRKRLSVAECLAEYETALTLSQIKSLRENPEQAYKTLHETFLRLAKKNLSREEWFQIATNVFGHIRVELDLELDSCAESMCDALIGSMNRDNINTAGCMLSLRSRQAESVFLHRLDEKKSLNIVLKTARVYLDSAVTYSDTCVGLAKSCLALIQDVDSEGVQKELNLIKSLPLLNKFGIQMLPVHVRSRDKLMMIKEVLVSNQSNYKNFNKINQLAQYLGIYDENPSHEGLILSFVAEVALKEGDYRVASNLCQRIMQGKHFNGWKACARLGYCEGFKEFQERKDLVGFCIAHAPPQHLKALLNELNKIELQEYYSLLEQKFFQRQDKPLSDAKNLMKNIIRPDAWLGSVTDTVKGFTVRNSFAEQTFMSNVDEDRFAMTVPSLCPFYCGLWGEPIIESRFELTFSSFQTDLMDLPEVGTVLRYASVNDRINGTVSALDINDDMILSLSQEYVTDDVLLAVCHLLSLNDQKKAEKLFLEDLPYTKNCLQIGFYFFTLASIRSEAKTVHIDKDVFTCMNRDEVISHVTSMELTSLEANSYKNVALKFIELESDLLQAQLVQAQSGGTVDVGRFGHDEVYKRETILGMAFSDDLQNFRVALNLAKHYDVSLFEVCFGHLEHLFLTCTHPSLMEDRLQQGDFLNILRQDRNKFEELLKQKVFPILIGTNYDQLKIYYNLILDCSQNELEKKKTEAFVALLNEVDGYLEGIDFKLLISSDAVKQREALTDIVDIDNIDNIAKVCARFKSILRAISKSTVIQVFLKNEFVRAGCHSKEKLKELFKDHLKYIGYLSSKDVIDFIRDLCFDPLIAAKNLSRGHRLEILKIFFAFAKHKSKLPRKTDVPNTSPAWEDTQNKLLSYMQHLQMIENGFVSELLGCTQNPGMETYVDMFEMTAGEQHQVLALLIDCTLSECDPSLLESILSVCPPSTVNCTSSDLFLKATAETLKKLRSDDRISRGLTDEQSDDCSRTSLVFQTRKPISVLRRLLVTGKKITDDSSAFDRAVVDLFRNFSLDKELELSTRLAVLRLFRENSCNVSEEDEALLLHLETMTLLQETWPDDIIAQSDTETPDGREIIFSRLLDASSTQGQLDTLCKLLTSWPASNTRPSPWYHILMKMSTLSTPNVSKLLSIHRTHSNLSLIECREIEKAWDSALSSQEKKLFRLESEHRDLHEAAIADITEDLTERMKDRILDLNLSTALVTTSHFRSLMNRLLEREDFETLVELTSRSLSASGFFPEVASLSVVNDGLPKALQTFSESMAYFHRKYENTKVVPQ